MEACSHEFSYFWPEGEGDRVRSLICLVPIFRHMRVGIFWQLIRRDPPKWRPWHWGRTTCSGACGRSLCGACLRRLFPPSLLPGT